MTSKTNASTKPKATKKTADSTERLRKAAIAEICSRIDGHEDHQSNSSASANLLRLAERGSRCDGESVQGRGI